MLKWITKVFGDSNERALEALRPTVERINALEPDFERLSNEGLRAKTQEFRERLASGQTLDDLLPEAFAAVREAAKRTLGQRHFDVQLMGGIVLHQGKIAEMKTGEGKTLVATLAAYLNALEGHGVHVVTVNDYLAKRDAQWMGPIYHLLGLSVGTIQHEAAFVFDPSYPQEDERLKNLRPVPRREAYLADITYGTNNEFGFDYLRDNMAYDPSQLVQRELHYAIVDEVDNILIDEARTPLIISGPADKAQDRYYQFARLVPKLRKDLDYEVDEKRRVVTLTERGIKRVEQMLGIPEGESLYDPRYYDLVPYLENALKAHVLFKRDRDYVVKDGQVIIVDEFTGRLMFGRRYSEGLHQAIEAKEGVRVQRESRTLATITLQNYFRMYRKLAGMTGTAATEAEEFFKIYGLEVVAIPTHKPMIRIDYPDVVYKTEAAKFRAVVREIKELYQQGRPVLVGTLSIEKSERLSEMLRREGIPHQVLNAKYHEKEAAIIAQAGQRGSVTIATNMAGRGVDIQLGPGVPELGGLHIIGTERHEARRIDNQLRGRAGRQGDPGSSRFYVSLEDDLMRRFGSDRVANLMERLGVDDDTPIEANLVSKAIENAQVKVEGFNFDIRKHVVQYDDVMNKQREVIYSIRRSLLTADSLHDYLMGLLREEFTELVEAHREAEDPNDIVKAIGAIVPVPEDWQGLIAEKSANEIVELAMDLAERTYQRRLQEMGPELWLQVERLVVLRTIDNLWADYLTAMDELREGIGLRAYGQRDPLVEYKREAFRMFEQLQANIRHDIVHTIFHVSVVQQPRVAMTTNAPSDGKVAARNPNRKVGRNDPCPCGSGKKYKKCHGALRVG